MRNGQVHRTAFRYLRTIFSLGGHPDSNNFVRMSELSRELNLSLPTVSIMTRRLESRGLVVVETGKGVALTWRGIEFLAENCWKRAVIESTMKFLEIPAGEIEHVSDVMCFNLSPQAVLKLWKCAGETPGCLKDYVTISESGNVKEFIKWLLECCGLRK
ncbi:MAG: MarR family transcriptional regulator [Acidilobaceae archaeon]|nr:MarR family transcriptional regulator [Acidilobaceae archaeon]MCX8165891.1 MarR family transcriptional regulator [Acidilobaceae archaeon]MDW7974533.1 MarR family transcriptional regulator [Sulfolobales archaeon]